MKCAVVVNEWPSLIHEKNSDNLVLLNNLVPLFLRHNGHFNEMTQSHDCTSNLTNFVHK